MNFKTIIGTIKLTSERKTHIIEHHPIMEDYITKLKQVLEEPNEIRFSNRSDVVLLFYRYFDKIEGGKYIVCVVNKVDKQITTAYLSHRIKIGRRYKYEKKLSTRIR